jgi:hypothetical protein
MPLVIRTTGVEEYLDAAGEAHIKALILGEPSAGKTRSASFWPNPIFLDCEKGRMSLADRRVPFVEIKSTSDSDAIVRMLEVECATRKPPQRKYKTVVLDTIDSFQKVVVGEILKAGRKEALSGFQDWGLLDAKMNNFLGRLLRLPMNVIVNCHVQTTQDGDNGPLVWEPRLQGSIRKAIAGDFDLVGFMTTHWEAVNGQRELRRSIEWHPRPNFPVLKDRSGQLPQFTDVTFTDDDYLTLFERMFGTDYFNDLVSGEVIDSLPTDEPDAPEVVAPHAGGPVSQKPPAKAAAAKTAAPQAAPPAPKAEPAAKKAAPPPAAKRANVPPAKSAASKPAETRNAEGRLEIRGSVVAPGLPNTAPAEKPPLAPAFDSGENPEPEEAPDQPMEEAQALVEDALGGVVIAEDADGSQLIAPAAAEPVQTHVGGGVAVATRPTTDTKTCGTPSKNNTGEPAPGCGRDLAELSQPEQDLVNIALIKTRTYLCPTCLTNWRNANKK